MVNAGLLFRVSSPGQEDGYSLQDQERDCRIHCEKQGYQVQTEHVWNDGAQKSWTLNRPGLQSAFDAIRKGEIEVLVVGRYDRFSRVQMQQAVAIYEIEQVHGGRVESADPKEQFGRDSTGVLLRSINAWRAEQELDLIRERTQGGRRSRAKSGKLIASPYPLYGYLWADGNERRGKSQYVVDPEAAPIVERIFREVAAGVKLRQIALQLTNEKVPTPAQLLVSRGLATPDRFKIIGDWSRTMVGRTVKNPAYMGQYVAYRTISQNVQRRDESGQPRLQLQTRLRPDNDPARTVLPTNVCPPIVSREVFERVQEQLTRNKEESERNNRNPQAHLLRGGFAVCGHCGAKMTTSTCGPVGRKFYQYRCRGASSAVINRCPGGNFCIGVPVLDRAIWSAVQYLFTNPKRIRAILAAQLAYQADTEDRDISRKKALEGQLQQIQRQIDNATRAVLNASDDETHALWSAQVSQLVPQRAGIEKDLAALDEAQGDRQSALAYLQSVEQWCTALGPEIAQATYEEKRFLLRGLKTKVTCYRSDHDPKFTVEWDLAGLREPFHEMLPTLTDKDIAAICDSHNTYFRHQSPDYRPGEGFVAVRSGEEQTEPMTG